LIGGIIPTTAANNPKLRNVPVGQAADFKPLRVRRNLGEELGAEIKQQPQPEVVMKWVANVRAVDYRHHFWRQELRIFMPFGRQKLGDDIVY
jgi:hypothetical protein